MDMSARDKYDEWLQGIDVDVQSILGAVESAAVDVDSAADEVAREENERAAALNPDRPQAREIQGSAYVQPDGRWFCQWQWTNGYCELEDVAEQFIVLDEGGEVYDAVERRLDSVGIGESVDGQGRGTRKLASGDWNW